MPETDNDFELVKSFIEGNEDAFNHIVKKYQQKIYWHARRMLGNHLDADEVAQQVIIVLYNKLKTFNFRSSLYTWIYRIVSTRSINQIKKNKVKRLLSIDEIRENDLPYQRDIIDDISNKQQIEKVHNLLQKLPVKQREVFIMRAFDQLSYEEISKITGKSIGGLKANYFHALKKIVRMMKNEKG
ncbi:RNA polymerase sigma factor [Melioribacteraceae bacterium 4301-Me]|uniref:RNA polymerase sigma factor n=1 Tax=Pyranulibacter aquaticus TaxID=3163344 RepID=UPI003596D928